MARPTNAAAWAAMGLVVLFGHGCEKDPKDTQAGYALTGQAAVGDRVADWSFSDAHQEVFVETQTWYGIPHSVTVWCVSVDGRLFVGSYTNKSRNSPLGAWDQNVERYPAGRIKIGERVFEVIFAHVEDASLVERIAAAYESKYDMTHIRRRPREWWYYEVSQR